MTRFNPNSSPAGVPFTRRRFTASTAAMASAAGLATFLKLGPRSLAAQSSTPASDTERTVETIHGPVTVPANPQRIVAVNFPSVVTLLELGILPVGITSYVPKLAPGTLDPKDVPAIESDAGEIDLELIASLQPDLIVGSDWKDPADQLAPYKDLSRIAPTVLAEWTQAAGNWPVEAALTAEAIGKTQELEALKQAYEDQLTTIKTTYADAIAAYSWDVITNGSPSWFLYSAVSSHGKVVVDAGIHLQAAAEQETGFVEYSVERLDVLKDTDVLLIDANSLEATKDIPAFAGLPAAKAGHVYPSEYFFPSSYGISTALLHDIEAALKQL